MPTVFRKSSKASPSCIAFLAFSSSSHEVNGPFLASNVLFCVIAFFDGLLFCLTLSSSFCTERLHHLSKTHGFPKLLSLQSRDPWMLNCKFFKPFMSCFVKLHANNHCDLLHASHRKSGQKSGILSLPTSTGDIRKRSHVQALNSVVFNKIS